MFYDFLGEKKEADLHGALGMPPLGDPETRRRYCEALSRWKCEGYVVWKPGVEERLSSCLPEYTKRAVSEAMAEYVRRGGEIDQQPEIREQWSEQYDYHYDLRIRIGGKLIYIETVFPDWEDDPSILVVNIHDA